MFTAEPGISYTNAVLGYNYAALNGSASGRVNGGYGGGYLRFKSDSAMEAHTLLSNGTDRLVWQIFDGMMGIGANSNSTNRLIVQGVDYSSTNYIFRCLNGGAGDVVRVRNDAVVWAYNTWTNGSDARMKRDIVAA